MLKSKTSGGNDSNQCTFNIRCYYRNVREALASSLSATGTEYCGHGSVWDLDTFDKDPYFCIVDWLIGL